MKIRKFKIVSGGQTGVDRAALDFALAKNIPCGGWCPKGRLAEDGIIDTKYPLQETPLAEVSQRTEWNVRDSDGTLVITIGEPKDGTGLTIEMAQKYAKPHYLIDMKKSLEAKEVRTWLKKNNIQNLNIAGPRASHGRKEEIYTKSILVLESIF